MDNFVISKNNEWKEVVISNKNIQVPHDWNITKIGNLFTLSAGGDLDKNEFSLHKVNKYIYPIYSNSGVAKGIYGYCSFSNRQAETITVTARGTLGFAFYRTEPYVAIGRLLVLTKKIDLSYKFYEIYINNKIKISTEQTTIPQLTAPSFSGYEVYSPPLEQQNSIATILSAQEKIIEDTETLISKYEKRAAYLTEELLSGRLRVKEVEGETIFYKNPKDNWKEVEVNGEVKEIPKDWSISKTKDITVENSKSKLQINQLSKKDTYPAFSCSDNLVYYSKSYLIDGENIFLSTGGNAAVHYYNGKSAYSTDVYSVKTININTKIFTRILKHNINQINNLFYGAGLKHLNKSEFKNHEWIIPNQGNMLEKVFSQQETLIETEKLLLSKEKIKIQWLLDNLLSGNYLIQSKNH